MKSIGIETSTLVELLRERALHTPGRVAYTFLTEDDQEISMTYGELDLRARALAVSLSEHRNVGDRALLLFQPGLEYLVGFFGCLYAGVVAVPAYPPRQNGNVRRVKDILADAQATLVLTTEVLCDQIQGMLQNESLQQLHWVVLEQVSSELASAWSLPELTEQSLAFLQYTSGSTSTPKGVMLSHGNLMHNLKLITQNFGTHEDSRCVIWLPPYHDMGLIGGILNPLYAGYPVTLMAPVDFIRSPLRWLQTISRTRATVSGGPNFAYDLCLRKLTPEQIASLDLRSWEVAFTGAEPIRYETLEQFADAFAPSGFAKESFYPCYGLAEGTLFVSGGVYHEQAFAVDFDVNALERREVCVVDELHAKSRKLVSSGQVNKTDQQVLIVHPDLHTVCTSDQIGEIWVRGNSVAQGYWNRPEQTHETFGATLADGTGPFLRTGDLGFFQEDRLFVAGRIKDLIIIRGRNYYPQDVEFVVQNTHAAVRSSNGAAFSIDVDGEEKLVLVHEVERTYRKSNLQPVMDEVRRNISEQFDLQVYSIVLIKPGSIPKTSSGKVQRHACKQQFLDGTLEILASSSLGHATTGEQKETETFELPDRSTWLSLPETERAMVMETYLMALASQTLHVSKEQLDVAQPLTIYGLDSIQAIDLKNAIEEAWDVDVPLTRFLDGYSLSALAQEVAMLAAQNNSVGPGKQSVMDEAVTDRTVTDNHAIRTPLTPNQRSLWILQQMDPAHVAYNVFRAVRINGNLNTEALEQALSLLAERHAILRTTFHEQDGEPFQVVQATLNNTLTVEDASSWSEEQLASALVADAHNPFDLSQSIIRVKRFVLANEASVLLFNVHHIAVDLWSFGLLFDDLWSFYKQITANLPLDTTAIVTFSDYVTEQATQLSSAAGERLWSYWKQQLASAPQVLDLPTDFPRPAVKTYHGAVQPFHVSSELWSQLLQVAQQQQVTPYVLLLSAYQMLLHRYTGQSDLVVGSPMNGRSRSRYAQLAGYLVNPVLLRAQIREDETVTSLLQQMKRTVLSALDHQDYPFPLLAEKLVESRDPSTSPLFQTLFVLQKTQSQESNLSRLAVGQSGVSMQIGDVQLESLPVEQQFAQFDLTLSVAESDGALEGFLEYNTDLFRSDTAERIVGHFQSILRGIVQDAQQPIAHLPLLTVTEVMEQLAWNDTAREYPLDRTLHQWVEDQVAKSPDRIAVVYEDRSLTYHELNEAANRLAHGLQASGIQRDDLVGVFMERSLEMVVSLLGILKAGGAYLPLDPAYPADRLTYMIQDANVSVLLTQSQLLNDLPETEARAICLDQDPFAAESSQNPMSTATADSLAYVIYTSGSTGRPKGVMVPHRGICNRLLWMQDEYQLTEQDHILQKTPFSFDVSVWEFFWPLMVGARLVMARPGGHQDSRYLVELIEQQAITTLHFVPSMLQVFLEETGLERCHTVRQVMCSGEALPYELVERFYARMLGHVQLHNLYGPTEASVDVTYWHCPRENDRRIVPIGRPIANISMHILDPHLQRVPIGVPGELHIGGVGLARGYLNRPELTAEKFIASPFSCDTDARLYKTGDLARYLPDGAIEYLGRLDHQVKIRGFRIELGEIEAVITDHPSVREAVVTAISGNAGSKRLAAYIVFQPEHELSTSALRQHLSDVLPEFMVPSHFVTMDALPLSPNGKVDRKALLKVEAQQRDGNREISLPQTDVEQRLAAIWQRVLGVEVIGLHDNFFELGGDSILVMQVVIQARQEGLQVTPAQMLQHRTLAELSRVVQPAQVQEEEQGLVVGNVPLTPIQHWFMEQSLPDAHHWNQSVLLTLREPLPHALIERVIEHLVQHHDALRTRFVLTSTSWRAEQVAEWMPDCVHHITLPDLESETVRVEADRLHATLHLADGSLLRVAHLQTNAGDASQLLIVIHHLVVDGVSWRILLSDLQTAIEQVQRGKEVQLPSKTTSYKRWAERLVQHVASGNCDNEREHWSSTIRHATPLPLDRPTAANTEESLRDITTVLRREETQVLLQEANKAYHTEIQDLLLVALLRTFSHSLPSQQLRVDLEGHGREELFPELDLTRTVGWFTSLYPVRLHADANEDLGRLIKQVKEQLRAVPHHGIGYGLLRFLDTREDSLRDEPHAQADILFNYLGQLDQVETGLTAFTAIRHSVGTARSARGNRPYPLEIIASVQDGCLHMQWNYSAEQLDASTVQKWADDYQRSLSELLTHCQNPQAGGFTPSDFKKSGLNQKGLDHLLAKLTQKKER